MARPSPAPPWRALLPPRLDAPPGHAPSPHPTSARPRPLRVPPQRTLFASRVDVRFCPASPLLLRLPPQYALLLPCICACCYSRPVPARPPRTRARCYLRPAPARAVTSTPRSYFCPAPTRTATPARCASAVPCVCLGALLLCRLHALTRVTIRQLN